MGEITPETMNSINNALQVSFGLVDRRQLL
jgi:hypothetical protein